MVEEWNQYQYNTKGFFESKAITILHWACPNIMPALNKAKHHLSSSLTQPFIGLVPIYKNGVVHIRQAQLGHNTSDINNTASLKLVLQA